MSATPERNRQKAEALRSRAGRFRNLAAGSTIPAIAASLRRLASLLEQLARKFEADS